MLSLVLLSNRIDSELQLSNSSCSDSGTSLTWQGAHTINSGGSAERNKYQYACLASPVTVAANARYGVSSDDKDASTPAKWGRVYGYGPDQIDFPCGEHIGPVSKHIDKTQHIRYLSKAIGK